MAELAMHDFPYIDQKLHPDSLLRLWAHDWHYYFGNIMNIADNMVKIFRFLGLIFILLGVVMLVTGGFELKRKKKVLDTEVVDVNTKETKRFSWHPYVSVAVIAGGVALLIIGGIKRRGDK